MKLTLLGWMMACVAWAAGWESVQRLTPGQQISIGIASETVRGTFVSADDTALVVRTKSGERSMGRASIRRVEMADPSRRTRAGLLGTAIGIGVGAGIGFAVCPHCSNEGKGGKFVGPGAGVGAGLGAAAGFLPMPYRTIYRIK